MTYRDATRHRRSIANHDYFITFCTRNQTPVFSNFKVARQLVQVFRQAESEGRLIFRCWVIMPDHVHLLVTLLSGTTIGREIGYLKSTASRQIDVPLRWQTGFYERFMRSDESRLQTARYIVMNPVRAGLVGSVRDYPHWDSVYF